MKRRDFLTRGALAASVAPLLDPLASAPGVEPLERRGSPQRVIVVGAGLAGLCAAHQLVRAGHEVLVLEAQRRAGGRVETWRDFAEELSAETGATRIPAHHFATLKYVKAFGLELDPFRAAGATTYHVDGRNQVEMPRTAEGLALAPLLDRAYGGLLARLGDASAHGWTPPADLRRYDAMTFTDLLREAGLSESDIRLRRTALAGWDDTVPGEGDSALRRLRTLALESPGAAYHRIRGGNDRLPRAFALRLADRIRYGCPVVRIERLAAGLRVVWNEPSGTQAQAADRVVLAIPFTLLRRLEIAPPLSPEKARAVARLSYAASTKVFLQTRTRFWENQGLNGFAYTDLLDSMQVWELGHAQPGPRGLLVAYTKMSGSHALDALDEDRRVASALDAVARVRPELPRQFEGGRSKSWMEDPWARGAFAILRPGDSLDLEPHIGTPEGRLHFAGEHTSPWLGGWMHSALESGERAAREVNAAV